MAARKDNLSRYRAKRDFTKTPEPAGKPLKRSKHSYLIQKHAASRLHYDFRLELNGTLKSWAVTRGPSLDPADRRLAVEVEDHPVAYGTFEGIIPKGQYGGGTVMLWDRGSWEPIGDAEAQLKKGKLTFILHGERLKGEWSLVRMHTEDEKRNNWLLIKKDDDYAKPGKGDSLIQKEITSIVSARSMEEISAAADRQWQSNRATAVKPTEEEKPLRKKKAHEPPVISAKLSRLPSFIRPELATLASAMPEGEGWVHEIKFDGYRMQARIEGGRARLLTRTGKDWTAKFPALARELATLPVKNAIVDGEAVAVDEQGVSSFKALQDALSSEDDSALQYYAFDLLHLDGKDLMRQTLLERKKQLQAVLAVKQKSHPHVLYSEHFSHQNGNFLQQACRLRLEGVISKRADAPYRPGRGTDWLKAKCHQRQEFVIGGFTLPTRGNRGVGALLLGHYEGDRLLYAGRVGTGFTSDFSHELRQKLEAMREKTSSYVSVPAEEKREAKWVRPALVCEVEFTEWTPEGRLRHPSFQGLREDKPASSVHRDVPVSPAKTSAKREAMKQSKKDNAEIIGGIKITHPDRIMYSEQGITKAELAHYYLEVADYIVPYVKNRPLSMIRCPEDIDGECFFQRHLNKSQSPYFHDVPVTVKGTTREYFMIKDAKGLISLVQWGVIELHPWACKADDTDKPDYLIFDLDPDPGLGWDRVVEAAREIRERMKEFKLESFVKTTGGKGLHVAVPIKRQYGWDVIKPFTRAIAQSMAADSPTRYTANLSKAVRKGRIFVDYLRNEKTSTSVAAFSARARSGATVSTPISWKELTAALDPKKFTIETVPRRLSLQKQNPWEEFHSLRQSLPKELPRALKLLSA